MPMQPSPIAETSRPFLPSVRFSIIISLRTVCPHLQPRDNRAETDYLILRSYCLFLANVDAWYSDITTGQIFWKGETDTITVTDTSIDSSSTRDRQEDLRAELTQKVALFVGSAESRITEIPGLTLYRHTAPTAPASVTFEPSVAVVVQGQKHVELGQKV